MLQKQFGLPDGLASTITTTSSIRCGLDTSIS